MSKLTGPILPDGRKVPHFEATDEVEREILRIVRDAKTGRRSRETDDPDSDLGENPSDQELWERADWAEAVGFAERAAEQFVSDKAQSVSYPEFRALLSTDSDEYPHLSKLRKAIENTVGALQGFGDRSVPFQQMRNLHCYGNAEYNGNERTLESRQNLAFSREDEWTDALRPSLIRNSLEIWLDLMDRLRDQIPHKPSKIEEQEFVDRLHYVWTKKLKLKASISNGSGKPSGRFVRYVYTAAKIIPEEYRPDTLNHQIVQWLPSAQRRKQSERQEDGNG